MFTLCSGGHSFFIRSGALPGHERDFVKPFVRFSSLLRLDAFFLLFRAATTRNPCAQLRHVFATWECALVWTDSREVMRIRLPLPRVLRKVFDLEYWVA